jgi:NAD(P)H dehydrogenase (quinone)
VSADNSNTKSNTNPSKTYLKDPVSVLVLIACPFFEDDKRSGLILELAKTYVENSLKQGAQVDVLNLYDEDFDPTLKKLNDKEGKILEYRIRVEKANIIAVFHPSWFESPPAILKGFLERVFVAGFAFRNEKNDSLLQPLIQTPLLKGKWLKVFTTSEKSATQSKYLEGNILENFWKRAFGYPCGFKVDYTSFAQIRSADETKIESWHQKVAQSANNIQDIKHILDLI